jgi:hypothetical protein
MASAHLSTSPRLHLHACARLAHAVWSQIRAAFYKGTSYVFYLYGPAWLWSVLLYPVFCWHKQELLLAKVKEYWLTSPVVKAMQPSPKGPSGAPPLTALGFVDLLEMLVGIAALQGTLALMLSALYQMPSGYAHAVATDEAELRAAVLECARLDAPVTGSHCIVNEEAGMAVTIGGYRYTVPAGTTLFLSFTLANTDEARFARPYVFDPSARTGLAEQLTSFNSVGERTNRAAPRICPGRMVAVQATVDLIKAIVSAQALQA